VKQVGFKPGVNEREREGVIDEQSGESKEEEVMGERIVESGIKNWYQNEVHEEKRQQIPETR